MNTIIKELVDTFLADTEVWVSGALSLSFGLWVLVFGQKLLAMASVVNSLGPVAPLSLIGVFFVIAAVCKFVGLWVLRPKLILLGSFLGFLLWIWLTVLMSMVFFYSTSTIIFPWLALWNAWIYLKYKFAF